MSEGRGSNRDETTRPDEAISRSVGDEEVQAGVGESARTNSVRSARVAVDQPSSTVGVRFPPCPLDHENAEGTSESGAGSDLGGDGRAPAPLVRLITLEDRLFVAISRRGDLSIAEFVHGAGVACCVRDLSLSDEQYVSACEDYANEIDPGRAA